MLTNTVVTSRVGTQTQASYTKQKALSLYIVTQILSLAWRLILFSQNLNCANCCTKVRAALHGYRGHAGPTLGR